MKVVVVKLIRVYQALSRGITTPFFLGGYSGCRSWPTCSDYAVEAVERDGIVRGGIRATLRFLRCNPISLHAHQ